MKLDNADEGCKLCRNTREEDSASIKILESHDQAVHSGLTIARVQDMKQYDSMLNFDGRFNLTQEHSAILAACED